MKLEFSRPSCENTQISNFMKILPVGAGLLHADRQSNGRTERNSEVNGHFLQFCEERLADATEHVPSWRAPVLPSVGEL